MRSRALCRRIYQSKRKCSDNRSRKSYQHLSLINILFHSLIKKFSTYVISQQQYDEFHRFSSSPRPRPTFRNKERAPPPRARAPPQLFIEEEGNRRFLQFGRPMVNFHLSWSFHVTYFFCYSFLSKRWNSTMNLSSRRILWGGNVFCSLEKSGLQRLCQRRISGNDFLICFYNKFGHYLRYFQWTSKILLSKGKHSISAYIGKPNQEPLRYLVVYNRLDLQHMYNK